jgi:hypothetical protein
MAVLLLVVGLAACGSADGTQAVSAATATPASATGHAAHTSEADTAAAKGDKIDATAFHADMRTLWEDHVTWTRLYIVSAIAGLPDLTATANRLLRNQDDIGNAAATFYGSDAGHQLSALLRDHILIAGQLVAAAKANNTDEVTAESTAWYANADEIAEFLAAANPAWPEKTLADMMHTHLDQTLAEATARLQGDWDADVAAYHAIHHHILDMADALADGIVQQFPNRFTAVG